MQSPRAMLSTFNAENDASKVVSLKPHAQTNFGWPLKVDVHGEETHERALRVDWTRGWVDINLTTRDLQFDTRHSRQDLILEQDLKAIRIEQDRGELSRHPGASSSAADDTSPKYWVRLHCHILEENEELHGRGRRLPPLPSCRAALPHPAAWL